MTERTLVILKPEVFENDILDKCFEALLLSKHTIIRSKTQIATPEMMRKHYERILSEISEEDGEDLINRMTRGPASFIVLEGEGVMKYMCEVVKPTLRHLYGKGVRYNVVHTSDVDKDIAEAEIKLWFPNL